ncbi:HTH-type transcriptional repressor FabR [Methylobacterium organophilum]|uniref:HTH-type transcriptional repressor FabR n=1 Tax=Methylobacterium organophilum TaxID=410 RepID=A0ABQ4T773_METOR|nr:TetR-like C-terminal domain-containing protein [Methylobacterium organophilum]UMY17098.1 WHG domain-containing protein [Methylobacterium organophilum]GJE26876.1 HTH-type transcriptional repressor FabR [Methylobacterium organophilum]
MITVSTSDRAEAPAKPGYHHGGLREALVAAGLAILEEGGSPASLGLREAARRAGVSAMAPYRHFPDKDALLAAVAVVGFERLRAALAAADGAGRGSEALIGQGVAYVGFACANPALFRLMFGPWPGGKPPALVAAAQASHAVLAERVAALVPAKSAADWTLRCWALVHGLADLALDGQIGGEDAGTAAALAERLLHLDPILKPC